MSTANLEAVCARLEAAVTRLENCGGGGGGGGAAAEASSASVEAYDEILSGPFAKFVQLSNSIGGDVAEQCVLVKGGFEQVRAFLVTATKHKKPTSPDALKALLLPISSAVQDVQSYRESHRPSKLFNHLSTISEAIGAIGWVAVEPKPGPYCKEMTDSGQFYSNRVLKEAKEKGDTQHTEWVRAFIQSLNDLQAYIKKHHTTGVVWNSQGLPAPSAAAPVATLAAAPAAAKSVAAKPAMGGAGAGGLFAALNKGGDVTHGLKKVSKDQMTHKNPELRGSSVVKASAVGKPASAPKTTAATVVKPPKFGLVGKKWEVEWQNNNQDIVIDNTVPKQTVYIYKCTNSTITVKGKVNNITLDGCKKTAVVFADVISGLDIINCQSVKAQVTVSTPIVNIDKTDGCQVYLSDKCREASIVTAKSSEVNIMVPKLGAQGEYTECALPEQFVNKWNGKGFTTLPSEVAA